MMKNTYVYICLAFYPHINYPLSFSLSFLSLDGLMSLTILGPTNSSQQEPSPYEWRDNEYFTTVTTGKV